MCDSAGVKIGIGFYQIFFTRISAKNARETANLGRISWKNAYSLLADGSGSVCWCVCLCLVSDGTTRRSAIQMKPRDALTDGPARRAAWQTFESSPCPYPSEGYNLSVSFVEVNCAIAVLPKLAWPIIIKRHDAFFSAIAELLILILSQVFYISAFY